MTEQQICEKNAMIAEYMGLKRGWWISQEKPLTEDKKQWCDIGGDTFLGSRVYYDKDLQFHASYDWIMPVFAKMRGDNPKAFAVVMEHNQTSLHAYSDDRYNTEIHIETDIMDIEGLFYVVYKYLEEVEEPNQKKDK